MICLKYFIIFFFYFFFFFFFFVFHWNYSPLWALACRKFSCHFFLFATNSLHLLTPSTWRPLSTSSFHLFLGLPLLLVPCSSWAKIFLGILSSIISSWPNQRTLCPFFLFTIFSHLLISPNSRNCRHFHSPFSCLAPYILPNIFVSKISRTCSSFFVAVPASGPYGTAMFIAFLSHSIPASDKGSTIPYPPALSCLASMPSFHIRSTAKRGRYLKRALLLGFSHTWIFTGTVSKKDSFPRALKPNKSTIVRPLHISWKLKKNH